MASTAKTSRADAPRKLPDPGSVALLGTVLELLVREKDGTEVLHSWRDATGPGLLWSPSNKALMFFPHLEAKETLARRGVELPKGTQEAAKLFTQWAARPSTRFTQVDIEAYPLRKLGEAVHIIYRSDKWNGRDGQTVDYIHHFSKSGTVKVSAAAGDPPKAFYIKGGRMTVNARGIVY